LSYTELSITTNFTFLRGASHPEELMDQAAIFGYEAVAVTDRNTFAGLVRAHAAAKRTKTRLIPGCRLDLIDGPSLLVYPTDTAAYSRLSNLLTLGNLRAEKGKCHLYKADVYASAKGWKLIAIAPDVMNEVFDFDLPFQNVLKEYREAFGAELFIAASRSYNGNDTKIIHRIFKLARKLDMPMVATNDVHYHHPARRELQDVMTCVREKCTIHNADFGCIRMPRGT
jgi:error-prone DNA polymerase